MTSSFILKTLLIYLTIFTFYASTWPNHAGTCDVKEVDQSPHAGDKGENIVQGNGGYNITVKKENDHYLFILAGPEAIRGLLVYVEDKDGKRFGEFTLDNKLLQYKDCEGEGKGNTITHTSNDPKTLPLELKWKSDNSSFGDAVVRSVVVIDFNHWYHLDDVKCSSS
ncbi:1124_t:CDS:1 [Funneliformis caledonium]|uniref:1124_t:CDS:1 n=1 Tax=Funneliformis caledonium TaxID=1117310 RepID=A0A9N9BLQ6_9GLOM|nr:1124_t:CDS:1 [Funneliformis caledonium]